MPNSKALAEFLKLKRGDEPINSLAERARVSSRTIVAIERGDFFEVGSHGKGRVGNKPNLNPLLKLAHATDGSVEEWFKVAEVDISKEELTLMKEKIRGKIILPGNTPVFKEDLEYLLEKLRIPGTVFTVDKILKLLANRKELSEIMSEK